MPYITGIYRIHTMVLLDELLYNYVSSCVMCIYRIYINIYIVLVYYVCVVVNEREDTNFDKLRVK